MDDNNWQFWIDRGGTFTDVVARGPYGELHVHKLLSEDPEHYDDAPLEAIRRLLGLESDQPVPSGKIAAVRMGTTLATNALLERKGVPVGLLITRGFRDLLEIGYQDRPELFALNLRKPEQLAKRIIEIDERVLAGGEVRTALDVDQVREALASFRDDGIESVAVVFMHSYAFPDHELRVRAIAEECGFRNVSLSHEVAREIKAVPRGDTTLVDAYLTPILRDYVARLREALGPDVHLRFMQSDGGLVRAESFSGKDAILSGPAGGVVAAGHIGGNFNDGEPIIAFDMGGTSTDVSRWHGDPDRVYESRVAGVRLKAPMVAVETVAAGGGSILRFDQGRFLVGRDSAGANPGPACYGRGGPATVTDANLVLGRIQPAHFPNVFGPKADAPLYADAAHGAITNIREDIEQATGKPWTNEDVAAGFIRVANENMVKPIKEISVGRGFDIKKHALVCFGGAGAQHACAIAEELGIETILLHPLAGVLSAYGMGLANITRESVEPVLQALEETSLAGCHERFEALQSAHDEALLEEGVEADRICHEWLLELRYAGTDSTLVVKASELVPKNEPSDDLLKAMSEDAKWLLAQGGPDAPGVMERMESYINKAKQIDASSIAKPLTLDAIRNEFERIHRQHFGFAREGQSIEIVNLRLRSYDYIVYSGVDDLDYVNEAHDSVSNAVVSIAFTVADTNDGPGVRQIETPVYRRDDLASNSQIAGPALIVEDTSTIVVDPGWQAEVGETGHIKLTRTGGRNGKQRIGTERDPVYLEIFNNLFMSVAGQMGKRLENAAHSVNIKERLDFSCALFTPGGDLVANAPHIPVHLGAMSESVKAVIAEHRESMKPGDVFATNDPYNGGSHLPDVTVVTPVFGDADEVIFYVANRGHHADIGGVTPGSMPPFSKTLDEEGVVFRNVSIVREGVFEDVSIRRILASGPYPARNIAERLSDLHAQIAANAFGVDLVRELCESYGLDVVHAYMRHVRANAAEAMEEVLREREDGTYTFEDHLDCGAKIAVNITIEKGRAVVDFTGTDSQLETNLNAPPAVVLSAVLYCFRTLIGKSIPLNSGCLDPVDVIIPEGTLLNPRSPAAVAGGNVETSMRVVDVVFGALGVAGASQGTMNNLTFGTKDWGYYETIAGGAGAGPGFHGASAVHTHMTNTRITDPEILEHRYPVVLQEFSIRRGSGGKGDYNGGDGVRRVIEFREALSCAMLSERRVYAPYGVNGGQAGQCGRNRLLRDNRFEELGGRFTQTVKPGDKLVIETPGGGGYNDRR